MTKTTYNDLWQAISPLYGEREAKAVARVLLADLFGMSLTDIVCGGVEGLGDTEARQLAEAVERLKDGVPVQYVTGRVEFCGRTFHVEEGVLVPRPETEQLCQLATDSVRGVAEPDILDIGTGSGCIATTLALDNDGAKVTAWDVSEKALEIARGNAGRLGARVSFVLQDALRCPDDSGLWDAIVSNPPYICDSERKWMESNVLDHEPHLALFVPDDDPLLFYRSIAAYAAKALKPNGALLFEINCRFGNEVARLLGEMGYSGIAVEKDIYGRDRNVIGIRGDKLMS